MIKPLGEIPNHKLLDELQVVVDPRQHVAGVLLFQIGDREFADMTHDMVADILHRRGAASLHAEAHEKLRRHTDQDDHKDRVHDLQNDWLRPLLGLGGQLLDQTSRPYLNNGGGNCGQGTDDHPAFVTDYIGHQPAKRFPCGVSGLALGRRRCALF
ncbi:hypothetical protein D3C78_1098720 [compost metagenome]